MANQKTDVTQYVLIGGALYVVYLIGKKLTDTLGITTSPEQQAINDETNASPWSINYYQQVDFPNLQTSDVAINQASIIHNAFGVFSDDYASILGVIKTMQNKAQVSYLSHWFSVEYQTDLYGFIQKGGGILPWDGLSTDHLTILNNIVNALPDK